MKCRTNIREISPMFAKLFSSILFFSACMIPLMANAATPHHITIALSNISEAISWYEEHLD